MVQEQKPTIIFDFDGVLRSVSWEGLMAAYEAIILAKGKEPKQFFTNLYTFKLWFDMDWHKNIESIDGAYVDDSAMNALFHFHYDPHVSLFPWSESLLAHLSVRYRLAILSSSSIHSVRKELGACEHFFEVIVGAEIVKKLKPHPEGVHYILNHFGVAPEHTLIIGDTLHDLYAGIAAGIKTAAVKWGLGEWNDLLDLNADFYFEKPEELFRL